MRGNLSVIKDISIDEVWKYLNTKMLYRKHLGVNRDRDTSKLEKEVEGVKGLYSNFFDCKVVFNFYDALFTDRELIVYGEEKIKLVSFVFPGELPKILKKYENHTIAIAILVCTVGERVLGESKRLKNEGRFLHSHILQSLAVVTAEALIEYLHQKVITVNNREIKKRFSFGYPDYPTLKNQQEIFNLLSPEKNIGVNLTENFMMEPEASVSAICLLSD